MSTSDSDISIDTLSTTLIGYILTSIGTLAFLLAITILLYSKRVKQKVRELNETTENMDDMQSDAEHMANVSDVSSNGMALNTIVSNNQALAKSLHSLPRSADPAVSNAMTDNQAYGSVAEPSRIVYEDMEPYLPEAVVPSNGDDYSMTDNEAYGLPQIQEKPQRDYRR